MTTGISNIYFTDPLFRTIIGMTNILPVLGLNPVDTDSIPLKNLRGQMLFEITSLDNSFVSSLQISGGVGGDTQFDPSRNFYFAIGTNINCTVTTPVLNTIVVQTNILDAGGRTYELVFFPFTSRSPTIRRIAGTNIGNSTLRIKQSKNSVVLT